MIKIARGCIVYSIMVAEKAIVSSQILMILMMLKLRLAKAIRRQVVEH